MDASLGLFQQPAQRFSLGYHGNNNWATTRLRDFAKDSASKVPDEVFGPAEVLSFLLEQKTSPFGAVDGVETWVARVNEAASQLKRYGSWTEGKRNGEAKMHSPKQ
ncbi:Mitochondrial chaperone BCS1 [Penicillium majusculum]|nr:Mitochondrial chaperone BCS1 [Penicillium majusculum]